MEIDTLPPEVLVLVARQISPRDAILCRRVNRMWHHAFTGSNLNLELLKLHYPRCFELRTLFEVWGHNFPTSTDLTAASADINQSGIDNGMHNYSISQLFANIASRYYHLHAAKPRSLEKILIGTSTKHLEDGSGALPSFCPVDLWQDFQRRAGAMVPLPHKDHKNTSWCYGQQDGLLVYPIHPNDEAECSLDDTHNGNEVRRSIYPWRLLDLHTGKRIEIPFPHNHDRVVRRVRLAERVLAIEWCESTPHPDSYDGRAQCPHFVSIFDVVRSNPKSKLSTSFNWAIIPRTELRLYPTGLPLNSKDRYLSSHTRTHYAVYTWLSSFTKLLYDEHESECLMVYDISSSTSPPKLIYRMLEGDLDFYKLRQGPRPRIARIAFDAHNLYFVEEKHSTPYGTHIYRDNRGHSVRTTGIPIIPFNLPKDFHSGSDEPENSDQLLKIEGPRWVDKCGAVGSDRHVSCCSRDDLPSSARIPTTHTEHADGTFTSPDVWNGYVPSSTKHDDTSAHQLQTALRASTERWPGWAPCWRHEDFPYLTISEAADFVAGIRIAAVRCFLLETLSVHVRPVLAIRGTDEYRDGPSSLPQPPQLASFDDIFLADNGDNDGVSAHERQADWINMHQNNGVQNAARPSNNQQANQPSRTGQAGSVIISDGFQSAFRGVKQIPWADDPRFWRSVGYDPVVHDQRHRESLLDEGMWSELMGAGVIHGGERWVVGQDMQNRITIARF